MKPTPAGLPASQTPDELMIDWGNTPTGSTAQIYLPAVQASEVLALAAGIYSSHRLTHVDAHTVSCSVRVGGITYVPIPAAADSTYAGVLTVEPPAGVRQDQVFEVVVRQITNASADVGIPAVIPLQIAAGRSRARSRASVALSDVMQWRRVLGAFQLTIPVQSKAALLVREERDLSVLRWISEAIPVHARWYLAFRRYLAVIAGRVSAFGGDPSLILPSPTGDGKQKPGPEEGEEQEGFRGKIGGLIFDRFGDFEAFLLDTEDGERKFFSREKDVAVLVERAWRERLQITVWAERDEPHRPRSILVHEPPDLFRR
jgi:hypothetical protein